MYDVLTTDKDKLVARVGLAHHSATLSVLKSVRKTIAHNHSSSERFSLLVVSWRLLMSLRAKTTAHGIFQSSEKETASFCQETGRERSVSFFFYVS